MKNPLRPDRLLLCVVLLCGLGLWLAACGGSSSNPSGNQDGTAQTDTTVDSGSDARDAQTGLDVLPDAVSDAQTSLDIRADAASDLQSEDQSADLQPPDQTDDANGLDTTADDTSDDALAPDDTSGDALAPGDANDDALTPEDTSNSDATLADQAETGAPDQLDAEDATPLAATTIYLLQDPGAALPGDKPCVMDVPSNPVVVRETPVKLANVVVTGLPHSASTTLYRFYVAEKGGGAYSGIAVLIDKTQYDALADAPLALGDELTIVGQLQEWFCFTRILVDTTLPQHQLTRTATNQPLPAPVEVKSCAELEDERLEGVLVRFSNVLVTDPAQPNGEITVEDVEKKTCRLDDEFRSSTEPNLAFWSNNSNDPKYQDKPGVTDKAYRAVVGLVMYTFGKFNLEPRSLADLTPFSRCDDGLQNGDETGKDCGGRTLWINEISAVRTIDPNEFADTIDLTLEIVGPAGMDLSGWRLFVESDIAPLSSVTLAPGSTLSNNPAHAGFGILRRTVRLDVTWGEPTPTLSFALARPEGVGGSVQFFSFSDTFKPTKGPLKGEIPLFLNLPLPTTPGTSLSLVGMGRKYGDFVWELRPTSDDAPNDGQRFVELCPACALTEGCQTHEDCPHNCVGGVCTTCGDGVKDDGEECDAKDGFCDQACKRACLLGFEQKQTGTSCYMYFNAPKSWDAARIACMDLGGHLVAMSVKAEYDLMIASFGSLSPHILTGLNDKSKEGTLAWDLGALGEQAYTPYTNPDPDPTLVASGPFGNDESRDCLAFVFNGVFGTKPGQLAFRSCAADTLPYICEVDY